MSKPFQCFAVFTDKNGNVLHGAKFNNTADLKNWLETPTMKLEKFATISVFNLDLPHGHSPVVHKARQK